MRLGRTASIVAAAILFLLGGCGGSSGPSFNATPQIGCVTGSIPQCGIFPTAVTAGTQTFTLFINGANLIPSSQAIWDGSPRPTVFDQTTGELNVIIFAADVAQPGSANIAVVNPEPSGPPASSNSVSLQIEPASVNAPSIAASSPFAPASATAGAAAFTLTVNGANFATGDYLTWNGQVLQPSQLSATQIAVSIPATDVADCGSASIAVGSPAGLASPSVNYTIQGSCVPAITSISPTSTPQGAVPASITVNGSNFTKTSVVLLNGSPRATTFSSAARVTATPVASDVANVGVVTVTVVNPDGGISPSVPAPSGSPVNVLNVTPPGMARVAVNSAGASPSFEDPRAAGSMDAPLAGGSFPLLISAMPSGAPADGGGLAPAISADGRYVAFFSGTPDLASAGPAGNIFVRDTCLDAANCTPRTITVDSALDGSAANADSNDQLSMSADGRFVAFVSRATNLVPSASAPSDASNIFVRDLCQGPAVPSACVPRSILVSPGAGGKLSDHINMEPSISADGRFVTFVQETKSGATTLLVRDTCDGASAPVGCTPRTIAAPIPGTHPAVSATGRYVAFSGAPGGQIALWDTCLGADPGCSQGVTPMSIAPGGSSFLSHPLPASISADGRFVAFAAFPNSDGPQSNEPPRIFLRDACVGNSAPVGCRPSTVEITPDAPHAGSVWIGSTSISASGRFISFMEGISLNANDGSAPAAGRIYVHDTCFGAPGGCVAGTTRIPLRPDVTPDMSTEVPLTADGKFVVFRSGSIAVGDIWLAPTGF